MSLAVQLIQNFPACGFCRPGNEWTVAFVYYSWYSYENKCCKLFYDVLFITEEKKNSPPCPPPLVRGGGQSSLRKVITCDSQHTHNLWSNICHMNEAPSSRPPRDKPSNKNHLYVPLNCLVLLLLPLLLLLLRLLLLLQLLLPLIIIVIITTTTTTMTPVPMSCRPLIPLPLLVSPIPLAALLTAS